MKKNLWAMALAGMSVVLFGGCFDRGDDHLAKNGDPSHPSLQRQQPVSPATDPSPEAGPQYQ